MMYGVALQKEHVLPATSQVLPPRSLSVHTHGVLIVFLIFLTLFLSEVQVKGEVPDVMKKSPGGACREKLHHRFSNPPRCRKFINRTL